MKIVIFILCGCFASLLGESKPIQVEYLVMQVGACIVSQNGVILGKFKMASSLSYEISSVNLLSSI